MKSLLALSLLCLLALSHAGLLGRYRRGYLSRTGLCPNPATNNQIKDPRLNYMGMAVILKGDKVPPPCDESECSEDSHCDGDRKCCKNSCGASVCTTSIRDPDPCSNFHCPASETCKVRKVKCVMPECADAIAASRPICVAGSKVTPAAPQPAPVPQPAAPLPFPAPLPQTPGSCTPGSMLTFADGTQAPCPEPEQQLDPTAQFADPSLAGANPEQAVGAVEQQYAPPAQAEAMYPQQAAPAQEQSFGPAAAY